MINTSHTFETMLVNNDQWTNLKLHFNIPQMTKYYASNVTLYSMSK